MTEAEWLAGEDPLAMLEFLTGRRQLAETAEEWQVPVAFRGNPLLASDRKLRLFAVACCRLCRGEHTQQDEVARWEQGEAFADDPSSVREPELSENRLVSEDPGRLASWAVRNVGKASYEADTRGRQEKAALLREIVGNPFRPVVLPRVHYGTTRPSGRVVVRSSVCPWLTPAVLSVANAIYKDRTWEELPVLADALEEAGCTSEEILRHLRSERCRLCGGAGKIDRPVICGPDTTEEEMRRIADEAGGPIVCPSCRGARQGPHVRGCWALDLIIGKA